ncbi:MAG: formylmethanofuran dehydrogenase [Candidatus Atribacteria bacterium]|nr:MAG: formylmethanofuran dehydrogenase [Candidatus Atribacteria bacterium]
MSIRSLEEIVDLHGHFWPGLAIGYRMALAGLAALSEGKADDEEIVAIVENDACGVDALQVLTGCTFGKGNVIFRDYGKLAYTLISRGTGQGVRVVARDDAVPTDIGDDREERITRILKAAEADIVSVHAVDIELPARASIHGSVCCDVCGEHVMSTRTRVVGDQILCIPCSEKRTS